MKSIIINYLQFIVIALVIRYSYCCDQKACEYGTAVGSQVGGAVAAGAGLFGASCLVAGAFTLGFGCVAAAVGTLLVVGSEIGQTACQECSEPEGSTFPLEKLDEILQNQKESFQDLSDLQVRNQLENLYWFQKLHDRQKELLANQVVLKLNQQTIVKDLNNLMVKTSQLQSEIEMSQIITLYGEDISNLLHIQRDFRDMHKDNLGGIIIDRTSDRFLESALDNSIGVRRSSIDVIKMLTSGHPLKSESIWEVNTSYCRKATAEFFASLLWNSFRLEGIALAMKGESMSKVEVERFHEDVQNILR